MPSFRFWCNPCVVIMWHAAGFWVIPLSFLFKILALKKCVLKYYLLKMIFFNESHIFYFIIIWSKRINGIAIIFWSKRNCLYFLVKKKLPF